MSARDLSLLRTAAATINRIDAGLGRFYRALTYRDFWLYLSAALFVVLAMWTTPFSHVLREDAYNFVIKGMEISTGDFSVDREQAIGWPLLLAAVFTLLDVDNIFEAMFIARWVSIFCIALGAVVLGRVCGRLFGEGRSSGFAVAVVLTFILGDLPRFAARNAMTEPLFLLCELLMALFFVKAVTHEGAALRNVALASLAAACAYYVRPNGLFLFASMLITLVLIQFPHKRRLLATLAAATTIFILATLPYLYARYSQFGSPFDYGANSKYFVGDYEHVWAGNISSPSLWTYLANSPWAEIHDRFIDRGLIEILTLTADDLLPGLWIVLALTGILAIFLFQQSKAYIFPVILFVSVAGLSLVFSIFGSIRHLIYFIPLLLITAGFGFLFPGKGGVKIINITATVLTVMALNAARFDWLDASNRTIPEVSDHWAVWGADNMSGNVAIVEGGDILEMSEHYEKRGWRVAKKFKDVVPKIHAIRPGIYPNLEEALAAFKKNRIRYVITDRLHMKRRPYLRSIAKEQWRSHFRHLGHFPFGDKGTELFDVNLYEIVY